MHNYAKYAFFESWIKTTFLCISDDFKHFLFFHLKFFFSETWKISLCVWLHENWGPINGTQLPRCT